MSDSLAPKSKLSIKEGGITILNFRSFVVKVLLTGILIFTYISPASAEKKVALVIGNSAYEHASSLKNPVNDARAVAALFTRLGFDVHLVLDAKRDAATNELVDFSQVATGSDVAIFYYAGHGISLDGQNYLIPTDSHFTRASEVKLGAAIEAETAIAQALSDAKVKLVFLDACRDNPFAGEIQRSLGTTRTMSVASGLSEMRSGEGTLIAFSTAPGQVALDGSGDTSPFAAAIVRNLSEPGLEIRLAMTKVRSDVESETGGRQIPWESTNLTGFYYLASAPAKDSPTSTYKIPAQPDNIELQSEVEFWRSVKDSGDPLLIKEYITRFPAGLYRSIAEALLNKLTQATVADEASSASTLDNSTFPQVPIEKSNAASPKGFKSQNSKKSKSQKTNIEVTPKKKPPPQSGSSQAAESPPKENANGKAKPQFSPTDIGNLSDALTSSSKAGSATNSSRKSPKETQKTALAKNQSSDESAFLGRSINRSDFVWRVPPGATKSVDASNRKITVGYKGRQYVCFSTTGMESSVGKVVCRAR